MTLPYMDNVETCVEMIDRPVVWGESQGLPTSSARWRAYLNGLVMRAVAAEYARDYPVRPWPNPAVLPSFWWAVNGSALGVGPARLVLIPEETLDQRELRIPQEWVDIPGWAGDYYLAIYVDPEAETIKLWGFTTHRRLKETNVYDAQDRCYAVPREDLFDCLLLDIQLQNPSSEVLRAPLPDLPALGVAQAHQLIARLSSPSLTFPRLAVPFLLWGALLEHGGWRQRLYEQRQGLPEQRSVLRWLLDGVAALGWTRLTATSLQGRALDPESGPVIFSRLLEIAGQRYDFQIRLVAPRVWRFQLQRAVLSGQVPRGFVLRLLTEDRQAFENNATIALEAVDKLFLDVEIDPGEGIVWEIAPTPVDYDPEILYFD